MHDTESYTTEGDIVKQLEFSFTASCRYKSSRICSPGSNPYPHPPLTYMLDSPIRLILSTTAAIIATAIYIHHSTTKAPNTTTMSHSHSHSHIEHANSAHWDTRAKDYDSKPWQKQLVQYIGDQLTAHRDMFGYPKEETDSNHQKDQEKEGEKQTFRLLDYACGPGTVTRPLLPFTSRIVGVDISAGMVAEYNERSEKAGTKGVAYAVQGNLVGEEAYVIRAGGDGHKSHDHAKDEEFNGFDAVIVGLGFHHFEDWKGSLRKLAQRVKPGGVVGIIDMAPSEMVSHYSMPAVVTFLSM